MTEQNKGRFEWQNFCHICPTAAEEAPHRKWYCSSGVPGRRHAVCPRHDCLQLLTRLHPRASGRTLLRQHQLQGMSTPNLFIHTSQRSSPPLTLLGFDAARVVKLNVRVPHSALKCLIWDTGCLCVVFSTVWHHRRGWWVSSKRASVSYSSHLLADLLLPSSIKHLSSFYHLYVPLSATQLWY